MYLRSLGLLAGGSCAALGAGLLAVGCFEYFLRQELSLRSPGATRAPVSAELFLTLIPTHVPPQLPNRVIVVPALGTGRGLLLVLLSQQPLPEISWP